MKRLSHRFGASIVPVIAPNAFFILLLILTLCAQGTNFVYKYLNGYLTLFAIFNIVPAIIMRQIFSYGIKFDEDFIYARPLKGFGPYMKMRFDKIDVVDLKAFDEIQQNAEVTVRPAFFVLYKNGGNMEDILALDPERTNVQQLKDLIMLIYDRRPETFTENARRYVVDGYTDPPRIDKTGAFCW